MRSNNINLSTCANFISDLEEKIMQAEDFVFPDIATPSNTIIILPRKSNQCKSDQLLFWVIDPDDIQFGQYGCQRTPTRLGVVLSGKIPPRGVKKCFNDVIFDGYSKEVANKQLDLRSMYSIFYDMMNGEQHFYPQKYERTMEEYHELLRSFNVPIGSPLYENSLATLSDDIPNNPISESLFELVEDGYDFEIYKKNSAGPQYRLVKSRIKVYQSPSKLN